MAQNKNPCIESQFLLIRSPGGLSSQGWHQGFGQAVPCVRLHRKIKVAFTQVQTGSAFWGGLLMETAHIFGHVAHPSAGWEVMCGVFLRLQISLCSSNSVSFVYFTGLTWFHWATVVPGYSPLISTEGLITFSESLWPCEVTLTQTLSNSQEAYDWWLWLRSTAWQGSGLESWHHGRNLHKSKHQPCWVELLLSGL